MDLSDAIAALTQALDECHSPAMLIDGIAVIARGIPRHTDDVDGTIAAEGVDLEGLVRILANHQIKPRVLDAIQFARQHQVLLLVHEPSATEIELSLAWLPFEQEALARAERLDLGPVRAPVATAEDLVIYKVVAWRERDKSSGSSNCTMTRSTSHESSGLSGSSQQRWRTRNALRSSSL